MNKCNCEREVTEKLLDNYKASSPDATQHMVSLTSYSLFINPRSGECGSGPVVSYEGSAEHPLKKGGTKTKKIKGVITANFCPFCGVNIKGDEPAPAAR